MFIYVPLYTRGTIPTSGTRPSDILILRAFFIYVDSLRFKKSEIWQEIYRDDSEPELKTCTAQRRKIEIHIWSQTLEEPIVKSKTLIIKVLPSVFILETEITQIEQAAYSTFLNQNEPDYYHVSY